jgi:hypothetical protein
MVGTDIVRDFRLNQYPSLLCTSYQPAHSSRGEFRVLHWQVGGGGEIAHTDWALCWTTDEIGFNFGLGQILFSLPYCSDQPWAPASVVSKR